MRIIKGRPSRSFHSVIGEISRSPRPVYTRKDTILVTSKLDGGSIGYKACITSGNKGRFFHPDHIYDCCDMDSLHDGDIVCINSDGTVQILWESSSADNSFMLTESCNCKCLMCPQPPKPHEDKLLDESYQILDLLHGKDIKHICITGGEPTLLGDRFIQFLDKCIREHPSAHIAVLTNGKTFSNCEFTKRVAKTATDNVCFCVSLHSEVNTLHDYLVGVKGSFSDTQRGLYNLAEYGCRIEIRHVISRDNARYLHSFAEHMYNYFPFCSHYAFMGMELYGNAADNKNIVDISPYEYRHELRDAVLYLYRRGLPVSIYNIPLCLCDPDVRKFARQSISSWKNSYIEKCEDCSAKKDCTGFFTTSITLPINHIQPI